MFFVFSEAAKHLGFTGNSGSNLSRDIYQAVLSVTEETTNLIAEVTTELVEDEDQNIGLSFVTVQKRS